MSGRPIHVGADVLAALRAAGEEGAVSSDIARATKRSVDNASNHLAVAAENGIAGWHLEPMGKSTKRRRWWLIEFLPRRHTPKLTSIDVQTVGTGWRRLPQAPTPPKAGVQHLKGWTHDARYQLAPGERPPALFSALPVGRYLEE